ncbi:ribosome recycling factor [Candidatus Poribacteria bacterium]|nr:ribosome recycling factor [Candidatus Poribacteria bacterium]
MPKELIRETSNKMEKALESNAQELASIRTGRASISLLDGVNVEYYGSKSPINQVASVSIPEARLIVIQPWDKSILKEIERALLKADLGLNINNDGNVIRITIPELTEQRRKELAKLAKKISEEGKISVRNIRREANESLKRMEKNGDISEDESRREQSEVQDLTDEYIKKLDEIYAKKEKEIMEV